MNFNRKKINMTFKDLKKEIAKMEANNVPDTTEIYVSGDHSLLKECTFHTNDEDGSYIVMIGDDHYN